MKKIILPVLLLLYFARTFGQDKSQIQVMVELTIMKDKLNEFKAMMPPIVEKVKTNESDILGYQWYLNKDQSKCYIIECFKSAEAWPTHLSNVGSMMPDLLKTCSIVQWEAFGNMSKAVEDKMTGMGATVNKKLSGFIIK